MLDLTIGRIIVSSPTRPLPTTAIRSDCAGSVDLPNTGAEPNRVVPEALVHAQHLNCREKLLLEQSIDMILNLVVFVKHVQVRTQPQRPASGLLSHREPGATAKPTSANRDRDHSGSNNR